MLTLLPKEKYHLAYNIPEVNLFPVIASIIYEVQDGKVYVDNKEEPNIIFITHKCSFSYLHIGAQSVNYSALLDFFYSNNDLPQYFHVYDTQNIFEEAVKKDVRFNVKIRDRVRMEGSYDSIDDPSINLDAKYGIKSIQQLSIDDLEAFSLSLISSFYSSIDDFLKNSIGWAITHNDKAVAMWYTLCVVNNNCDGDIWTDPQYRGLGFATIMGKKILKSYKEQGIRMDWDVFIDNYPSAKIGENFNYKPYHPYRFTSIYKLL